MKHFSPKQIFKIAFLLLAVALLAVVARIKQDSPNNVALSLGVPSASADTPVYEGCDYGCTSIGSCDGSDGSS